MPCCSSCILPIQGHQIPTGAKCSILFDEATHVSGHEPECTVCLQPWGNHPQGKHISKDCKFCQQQAPGDSATDDLEPAEDGDVHTRLTCIMQENQTIKAQLSQLMELVQQLLPQPSQATPQLAGGGESPVPAPPEASQAASTSGTVVSLPSPSWPHTGDPERTLGALQPLSPSHAGQHPVLHHGNPLPAVLGPTAGQGVAMEASPCQPWAFPASPGICVPPATYGLSPAQVPTSLQGKIQQSEYVDLSELLAYDFQYWYSSLDESQALEVVNGKLSLAPKHRARHLSNLQLWLCTWHLYKDTVLSFFPHRYLELSHY